MKINPRDLKLVLKKLKKLDLLLVLNALCIVAIGIVSIYSATYTKTDSFYIKQIIWLLLALPTFLIFSLIDYRNYSKYSKLIYFFNIVFLLSVYVFGSRVLGATRWIKLGPISIQPSEFAKLFIVLTFSELLVNGYNENFRGFKAIITSAFHILPVFLLIANQPDLGTSLVLGFLYMVLIFLSGIDLKTYLIIIASGICSMPVFYMFLLKDYQKQRILTFLNPEADILGSGWNVIQSMIAVGSGGLTGKGLLQGTQNKLKFLPEAHTDFIFAVLSEETGFVGAFLVIFLYSIMLFSIIKIGQRSEDKYGQLICYGIASILFFHSIVNVGMIIGVMPVTGLPLLLMNYGGTSLIFVFSMLGIVQSVRIYGMK